MIGRVADNDRYARIVDDDREKLGFVLPSAETSSATAGEDVA